MNRRSFFRKAVTVSAVAIAAPVMAKEILEAVREEKPQTPITPVDNMKGKTTGGLWPYIHQERDHVFFVGDVGWNQFNEAIKSYYQ